MSATGKITKLSIAGVTFAMQKDIPEEETKPMIEVKRLINDDTERGWYKLDGIDPDTGVGFGGEVYMISRHCAQVLDEFGMAPDHPGEIHAVYRLASQYEAAYLAAGMPGRENYTLCLYPEAAISNFDMKSGGLRSYEEPAPLATLKSIRSLEGECKKIMTIEPTFTTEVNEQCKRYAEAGAELAKYVKFEAAENDRIANLYGHGSHCAEICKELTNNQYKAECAKYEKEHIAKLAKALEASTFIATLGANLRKFLSSPEWLGAPLIEDASIEDAFNRMPDIDPPDVIVHKTSAVGPTVELLPGTPSTLCYTNHGPSICGDCANYKFMAGKCKFEMGLKESDTACTNEKFLPAGS